MAKRKAQETCARCSQPRGVSNRYCRAHQAEYMRGWRKTHPLSEAQRVRDNARSYVRVYIKRGKITPGPCEVCGSAEVQPHHEDYSQPLAVRWLCRVHHLEKHGKKSRV